MKATETIRNDNKRSKQMKQIKNNETIVIETNHKNRTRKKCKNETNELTHNENKDERPNIKRNIQNGNQAKSKKNNKTTHGHRMEQVKKCGGGGPNESNNETCKESAT